MVTPGPRQGSPPSTPPDFRVTSLVYNSVTFDWDPVSGEFLLYRVQVSRDSTYTDLLYNSRVSTDEATVTGLTGNTQYWARVRAEDINGMSGWNSISFTTPLSPPTGPSTPPDFRVTNLVYNSVTFDWDPVSGIFLVYRVQVSRNSSYTDLLYNSLVSTDEATVTGLAESTEYWARVRAEDIDGMSGWNSISFITPEESNPPTTAPSGLSITQILNSSARASWNSVSLATRYRIQADDTSNFFSPLIDTTTTSLTYQLSGLSGSTPYYVRVRAENDDGVGPWSNSQVFTTQPDPTAPTSAPGGLDVDNIDTDSADVSWNSVPDTDFYRLDVSENSSFTQIFDEYTTTELSERLSGLDDNTRYWLRVRAENDVGAGPWSNSVSFRTDQTPPTPPTPPTPRSISFTFQATPAVPPDPSAVTFTFQAALAESRNIAFDFAAIQDSPPRDVAFDFKGRRIIEPRSVSFIYEFQQAVGRPASFTFQAESEEEIPPVHIEIPRTGLDIAVVDRSNNNAYRVNPENPGSQDEAEGYGLIGRPTSIDHNDQVGALFAVSNSTSQRIYWIRTEGGNRTSVHSLDILTNISRSHGSFSTGGIVLGADAITQNMAVLSVDSFHDAHIRILTFFNVATRIGNTPDDDGNPVNLGSISIFDGSYYGTSHFGDDLWRINPDDTDSSAGVFGRVGPLTGVDFPAAFDIIDGIGYVAAVGNGNLYTVNLSDATVTLIGNIFGGIRPLGMAHIPKAPRIINRLGTPRIHVVDIQTRSALLLITRSAQATSYHVRVIRTSDNLQIRSISTTNATVLLDELDLDTAYLLRVQALTTDTDIDDSLIATGGFRTQGVRAVSFDFNVPVPPIDIAVISIIRIGFQSITFTSEHQTGSFQNERILLDYYVR